jgi:hypothetical protein
MVVTPGRELSPSAETWSSKGEVWHPRLRPGTPNEHGRGAIMRENTLKQRLYAGKAAFGVMCTFPSPAVVEMLGYLGFDWILLDNEHGSITVDTAEACIAAAELTGMAPIVRPVGTSRRSSRRSWIGAPGVCRFPTSTRRQKPAPPWTP